MTRLLAFALDAALVSALFSAGIAAFDLAARVIGGESRFAGGTDRAIWITLFALWAFLYSAVSLAAAGRTPAKAIVGLRVVSRHGGPLSPSQAIVRTLVTPVSVGVFGLGLIGIVVGKEHRALHDLVAGTTVVYDWGDRPAELPTPLSRFLSRRDALVAPKHSAIESSSREPTSER